MLYSRRAQGSTFTSSKPSGSSSCWKIAKWNSKLLIISQSVLFSLKLSYPWPKVSGRDNNYKIFWQEVALVLLSKIHILLPEQRHLREVDRWGCWCNRIGAADVAGIRAWYIERRTQFRILKKKLVNFVEAFVKSEFVLLNVVEEQAKLSQ